MEIQALGRYQVRGRIGRGTMGIVYRGYDPVLQREIALKAVDLPPALEDASRERFLARFFHEARIAAKLLHPGIVVTHDASTDETTGIPFIAMELVPGGSLGERMEREGRLPWREASRLVVSVARALDYAHREGVVHRDVKPANVLLTAAGEPKIADFGIAKLSDSHLTQTGAVLGTPYYMSPEQLEADEVDGRSDLFSLGSLFYALLTGAPPFVAPDLATITRQVLYKNPAPPSEAAPGCPEALDGVIARALAKRPDERYRTGTELADEAERVLRGEAPLRPLVLGERTVEATRQAPEGATVERNLVPPRASRPRFGWLALALAASAGAYAAAVHHRTLAYHARAWFSEAESSLREQRERSERRKALAERAASRLAEARELFVDGRWNEAGGALDESLALGREAGDGSLEAGALLLRGLLRAERGAWSDARADLDAAVAVFEIYDQAGGRAAAGLELANLERDLGSYHRAESLYDSLPPSPELALGRAVLELLRGELQTAETGFRRAFDSAVAEETRSRAAIHLAALCFAREDFGEAERWWARAEEGASHEADMFRAYSLLARGRVEESVRIFERAAELFRSQQRPAALASALEGLQGRTDAGPLRTLFLAEPRTERNEERRSRIPDAISPR